VPGVWIAARDDGEVSTRIPWQLRFAALSLTWGASFLLIKLALRGLYPLQIAFGRTAIGAAVLLVVIAARREPLPRDAAVWGHLLAAGLLLNAIPFALFAWAETRVPSILAGVYNAAAPLVTLALATLMLPAERPTPRRVVGVLGGLAGVLVVLGAWRAPTAPLSGQLAALAATSCYACAYVYVRRFLSGRAIPVASLATGQLLCAMVELAPVVPRHLERHVSATAVAALLVLGAVSTAFAYLLSHSLIRERGATTASLVNYPIPAVAVLLGLALLGEPLHWNEPAGAAIVLLGVWFAEGRSLRRARAAAL